MCKLFGENDPKKNRNERNHNNSVDAKENYDFLL